MQDNVISVLQQDNLKMVQALKILEEELSNSRGKQMKHEKIIIT